MILSHLKPYLKVVNQKIFFTAFALWMLQFNLFAQKITNIRVIQEGNDVIITYDLSGGNNGQSYDIELSASDNNGMNFLIIPKSLQGELKNIAPGSNKKIIWSVLNDRDELTGDGFVFQLNAIPKIVRDNFSGNTGTFTDRRDGEIYKWIRIGTQVWMAENLKTTKYNDGTLIPNVTENNAWAKLASGAYCWYNNEVTNKNIYGALYNWHALETGKLCPEGWHVPTDAEWITLVKFLGGAKEAGGKMKSTTNWKSPNKGATNESEFSALPSGYRFSSYGAFKFVGGTSGWWSVTEYDSSYAWRRGLDYGNANFDRRKEHKRSGFCVRCVRDMAK